VIITPSTTIRSGAFPRAWVPVQVVSAAPRRKPDDAALLARVSELCARSYKRTAESFVNDRELEWARHRRGFVRREGRMFWRPLAMGLMAVNYVAILIWLVALLIPLLVVGSLTELVLYHETGVWLYPFTFALTIVPILLFWLGLAAGIAGLLVGAMMACKPRFASGRAFGLVDPEAKRAIVIFCGSERSDNLTINALIWPYFFPMRHMGFHRAWDHIRPDIRQWLQGVVSEGQASEVVVAGHSLGGALAQIAGYDLAAEFPVGHVISLGSACIGGSGMQKRFAAREVSGRAGRLHDCTRHFTYTGDVMPRIPPVSIFRQVGRRYCLPENGNPIEGSEQGLLKSFGWFFLRTMSAYARFILRTMTRFRAALWRKLSSHYKVDEPLYAGAPDGEGAMPIQQLFGSLGNFLVSFPIAIPYALAVGAVALTLFPIAALVTMYGYYFSVFKSGLLVQHSAANYRNAFRRYLASLEAGGDDGAAAAAAR